MYKWPADIPLSLFQGKVIEAITFTPNAISMAFDDGLVLAVESRLCLRTDQEEETILIPASKTGLPSLVGKAVQKCALDADGASLLLGFADGTRLRLEGGDEMYECYHVHINGTTVTI